MRVVVIGGTGHIGSYLIPRLVETGHEVINISRGEHKPYQQNGSWNWVRQIVADREAETERGIFAGRIRNLEPDVVVDLISYTVQSTRHLVETLEGRIQLFMHCGTTWVTGPTITAPTTEEVPRHPFGTYGIKKAAIEQYLLEKSRRERFPATILHPGHIVGPGWIPINPAGNRSVKVFEDLANGEPVVLPNIGLETLHHVHADDVAQAFMQALRNWSSAVGESFFITSPAALSLRGYAEEAARWFGKEANLKFMPWNEWSESVSKEDAEMTWDHIAHSPCYSIEKARRLLDYRPRYSSLQAIHESVRWLIANGQIKLSNLRNTGD